MRPTANSRRPAISPESSRRPASSPRSSSRSRVEVRSTSASAATAPAATRCCSCPTLMSCPRRRSAGPTPRSTADLADGYVYGRGAVDMKNMVAMELAVVLQLAAEARAAGLRSRPRPDPRPAPRRALHLHRRRGGRGSGRRGLDRGEPTGLAGRGRRHQREWGRRPRPWPASGSTRSAWRRRATPPTGSTSRGTWGHGSMPREDNAAVLAAAVDRTPGRPRGDPPDAGHGPIPRIGRGCAAGRSGPRRASARRRRRRPHPGHPRRPVRRGVTRSRSGRCCATRSARTSSTPGSSTTSSRATP